MKCFDCSPTWLQMKGEAQIVLALVFVSSKCHSQYRGMSWHWPSICFCDRSPNSCQLVRLSWSPDIYFTPSITLVIRSMIIFSGVVPTITYSNYSESNPVSCRRSPSIWWNLNHLRFLPCSSCLSLDLSALDSALYFGVNYLTFVRHLDTMFWVCSLDQIPISFNYYAVSCSVDSYSFLDFAAADIGYFCYSNLALLESFFGASSHHLLKILVCSY